MSGDVSQINSTIPTDTLQTRVGAATIIETLLTRYQEGNFVNLNQPEKNVFQTHKTKNEKQ